MKRILTLFATLILSASIVFGAQTTDLKTANTVIKAPVQARTTSVKKEVKKKAVKKAKAAKVSKAAKKPVQKQFSSVKKVNK